MSIDNSFKASFSTHRLSSSHQFLYPYMRCSVVSRDSASEIVQKIEKLFEGTEFKGSVIEMVESLQKAYNGSVQMCVDEIMEKESLQEDIEWLNQENQLLKDENNRLKELLK